MPLRFHTECNGDWDSEQIGSIKLCGTFHITPETEQGLRPIVPHGSCPCFCAHLGLCSAQCDLHSESVTDARVLLMTWMAH